MKLVDWGRRGICCAALFLVPNFAVADAVCATRLDTMVQLGCVQVDKGEQWHIFWNHSVEGFLVEDVYENRNGQMVLVRSHQPDFAAGLGHIPGRGVQTSDGKGGYWIENIDEPVPGNAYVLRPGSLKVNHRLTTTTDEIPLSVLASHLRVRLELILSD